MEEEIAVETPKMPLYFEFEGSSSMKIPFTNS